MKNKFEVKNVSKVYQLRKDVSSNMFRAFLSFGKKSNYQTKKNIVALDNVTVDFSCGELVGIIGRNGAGKSTLLKLLSNISPISAGCIKGHGFVFPMLETNAAFNKNLTIRENIKLVSILVKRKTKITSKEIQNIVEDAELKDYLDQPLSALSSGMIAKLTTCIGLNIGASLILIDELMSNVDLITQNELIGKLKKKVSQKKCCVLIVSHDLKLIHNHCNRAIVLRDGKIDFVGKTGPAIKHYAKESSAQILSEKTEFNSVFETVAGRILELKLSNDGNINSVIRPEHETDLIVSFKKSKGFDLVQFNFDIWSDNVRITSYRQIPQFISSLQKDIHTIFRIPALPFSMSELDVRLSIFVSSKNEPDIVHIHKASINNIRISRRYDVEPKIPINFSNAKTPGLFTFGKLAEFEVK